MLTALYIIKNYLYILTRPKMCSAVAEFCASLAIKLFKTYNKSQRRTVLHV